ncbi:Rv3654c family TadE-like protein [Streptomyces sundarbansensis]
MRARGIAGRGRGAPDRGKGRVVFRWWGRGRGQVRGRSRCHGEGQRVGRGGFPRWALGRGRGTGHGADRGVATVWAAVTATGLCTVFAVVLALGQAVAARHRAGGAADMAALAAADRALEGVEVACGAARRVALAQDAEVVRCAVEGEVADVTTRAGFGPYLPTVRARAGPAAGPSAGAAIDPLAGNSAGPAGSPSAAAVTDRLAGTSADVVTDRLPGSLAGASTRLPARPPADSSGGAPADSSGGPSAGLPVRPLADPSAGAPGEEGAGP